MLHRRQRGKEASLNPTAPLRYGEQKTSDGVENIELLEKYRRAKHFEEYQDDDEDESEESGEDKGEEKEEIEQEEEEEADQVEDQQMETDDVENQSSSTVSRKRARVVSESFARLDATKVTSLTQTNQQTASFFCNQYYFRFLLKKILPIWIKRLSGKKI